MTPSRLDELDRDARRGPAPVGATCVTFLLVGLCGCSQPERAEPVAGPVPAVVENAATGQAIPDFFAGTPWVIPFDVAGVSPASDPTADATQLALAVYAWREFIAVNWASDYAASKKRGEPDTAGADKGLSKFLRPDPQVPRVWQTFKHRVEVYPHAGTAAAFKSFDSPPQYEYCKPIEPRSGTGPVLSKLTTYFNNLDETSEIGLCTLFVDGDPDALGAKPNQPVASALPGAPRRVIYQAKANRDMFDYVAAKKLYDPAIRESLITATKKAVLAGKGGLIPPDPNTLAFPEGSIGKKKVGTVEVKASWRQLTWAEYRSGRFLTGPIIRYLDVGDEPRYEIIDSPSKPYDKQPTEVPYGLVGLHIIHKTENVPTFSFATFEQVDNLTAAQGNQLFFYNNAIQDFPKQGRQNVNSRPTALTATTVAVNAAAHEQIRKRDPRSVWRYYQLIGVQGPASSKESPNYDLANIVTETNEILAKFSGSLNKYNGTIDPRAVNTWRGKERFVIGGCKGCHGNAQIAGADFSFITADAPFPEVDTANASLAIPVDPR